MRGGDRNPATKRKYSRISVPTSSDGLRRSKRLASRRPSPTNIYDIPKQLLVEILCRLPCAKSVYRCKSVSKSWRSLTSDPYFVGRFLWLQRDNQTLIPGTIINQIGDELHTTNLFARLRRFFSLKKLLVLATWNDLVLCYHQCEYESGIDYHICNPRTRQLVSLPPIHHCSCGCVLAVGFICDCEPYYKEGEVRPADNSDQNEEEQGKVIKIDAEYKCKVVRILHPDDQEKLCFEIKIQVFSSEIGEWRESLVSCPRGFIHSKLTSIFGFATNGMLYWHATDGDLLGLGPLMINNKSSTSTYSSTTANGDSGYQFHVIKLVRQEHQDEDLRSSFYNLQVHRGRLQLVQMVKNENSLGARLSVWELKKEELEQMAVQGGGELGQKHRKNYNIMDQVYYHIRTSLDYVGSDPNDLDTCFVSLNDDHHTVPVIYKCNIHTGEWSEMDKTFYGQQLQLMLPWWPTPVPTISVRVPMPNRNTGINGSEEEVAALKDNGPTDTSDGLRRSKRLASRRSLSTNIYDIPKELLVEILCRLPCAKSICRCKCVSKSWRSLTSDPYFFGRLLWLQRDNQTLIPGTIINHYGDELLTADLFERLWRFFKLKKKMKKLQVLATWNDLVLCCTFKQSYLHYYICNPRTMQLVHLPPIFVWRWVSEAAVGFICEPKEEEDRPAADGDKKEEERKVIKIHAEYKCKVVRILPPIDREKLCFEFKIQVFSSEIGEWRESVVSCPRGFIFRQLVSQFGVATNGMLYWCDYKRGDLLGLGPLMINNKSTTANGDFGYQFHVIKLDQQLDLHFSSFYYLRGHRGRLQLVQTVKNELPIGARLLVWELEKEELEQIAVQGGGELGQKHWKTYNILDQVILTRVRYVGFDPNDLDICFVSVADEYDNLPVIYKCNIHTGEWSKTEKSFDGRPLQFMLPWRPTPVPTISIPMPNRNIGINGSEDEVAALRDRATPRVVKKVKKTKDGNGVVNGEEGMGFQASRLSGRKHDTDVVKGGST